MEDKPIRLLLVEDNPGDAYLFQEAISEATNVTFNTTEVERLEDAIRLLEEGEFDVILLDLILPDGVGYETFLKTHAQAPDIPIIVLTGNNDDALALKCIKRGAQDYLVKGETTSQVLIRTIRHAIERHQLIMELEKTTALLARKSKALANTLQRVEQLEMTRMRISLDSCVDRALKVLGHSIEESRARITRDTLPEVWGDPELLSRVFQNLISNAIKFVGESRPEIHLTAKREDDHWVFGVMDNGIGISKRFANKVFHPFQRLNDRNSFAGTGIGLAICNTLIERHGGKIWLESEPGKGSHFKFTLEEFPEEIQPGSDCPDSEAFAAALEDSSGGVESNAAN